jgi:hypothetical protein
MVDWVITDAINVVFIISHNEELLQEHIVIVQFLTTLVGAGGMRVIKRRLVLSGV